MNDTPVVIMLVSDQRDSGAGITLLVDRDFFYGLCDGLQLSLSLADDICFLCVFRCIGGTYINVSDQRDAGPDFCSAGHRSGRGAGWLDLQAADQKDQWYQEFL